MSHEKIEDICNRFEAAWKAGGEPSIGQCLEASGLGPEGIRGLLLELVPIDLEYRWRKNASLSGDAALSRTLARGHGEESSFPSDRPLLEDYLRRFPALGSVDQLPADLIADEYHVRHRWGDRPSREEYLRRFPGRAQDVLAALADVDAGRPHLFQGEVVLEVTCGTLQGQKFTFDCHGTFLVGRAREAHLCLAGDRLVSSYHCRFELNPPACYVIDLGSRNGTTVNGEVVRERFLENGDTVEIGDTKLRVTIVKPPPGTAPKPGEAPTATFRQRESSTGLLPTAPELPTYAIVGMIGKGGMGAVFEATNRSTGQRVAIKVIRPLREASDQAVQLFLREASTLGQLKHKRIVQFYELVKAADQFCLVMEYVDRIDLREYLANKSPESKVRHYCGVICQVLEALSYAHRLGLVHRDIKPSNILVAKEGNRIGVKLADFGLAKNFQNAGFSGMTKPGEQRGTLPFMPPEQVVDARYAKPAADIYSAGATLYYFLAGRYPHDFTLSDSELAAVLEHEPVPLKTVRPDLPDDLVSAIHTAMAKDPAKRFPSAEAMYRTIYPFARPPGTMSKGSP